MIPFSAKNKGIEDSLFHWIRLIKSNRGGDKNKVNTITLDNVNKTLIAQHLASILEVTSPIWRASPLRQLSRRASFASPTLSSIF